MLGSRQATRAERHRCAAAATSARLTDSRDETQAERELVWMALHDALTGLPNRTLFVTRLREALADCSGRGRTVGVFVLDLDDFRLVNNNVGHEAGDLLLEQIGPRLACALRAGDTLARFGGDEFAVLCPALAGEQDAIRVARRLVAALAEPVSAGAGRISVTASVGIAIASVDQQAEDVLRDADRAQLRAKERGGAAYDLFDSAMRSDVEFEMGIERDAREALRLGTFTLAYQPILNLADESLAGCEALLRWRHPTRGAVCPTDLIPIAERTSLIVDIGDWVIREACRQMRRWPVDSPLDTTTMSVNVSARQFDDPGFPARVAAILAETEIDASRLRFEVTETALVEIPSQTVPQVMAELTAMGIELVLDDFGTGYSSLNYLRHFPIVGLKLDRSFVAQMSDGDDTLPIVEAVSGMARSLGLSLVAEGIETQAQLDKLLGYCCELGQGYLFGRPMPADELTAWAERRAHTAATAGPRGGESPTVGLAEAAQHLGVSVSTVRRWADGGRLAGVRTPGGHRRIFAAAVGREARRLGPRVELVAAEPPAVALPTFSELLAGRGEATLAFAGKCVYASRTRGWFGGVASEGARREWVTALRDGTASGDYRAALEASTSFFRRAVLGGASALERHLYIQRTTATFMQLLREAGAARPELSGAGRLLQAIEDQAVSGA